MSDKEFPGNEDLSLPKATVQKIISEILPQLPPDVSLGNDMTFTKGARDLLIQCSMEFLRMLSSESNEISEKESKKTIAVEHVEAALKDLGFGDYIEGIRGVVGEWKQVQTKRVNRGERMKNFGGVQATEEELAAMQAQLFGEARNKMEGEPDSAV
ncbi:negative cofactor 2 transcription regulator complex subunit ncb2 [Neophaeococcomyces mojaviensis]|uniref:Negative cofactor 2 transcription regulator complex subunit ncb2 n=1 Tax=Neophaeococcomyces mojaviensis TaxID=3383035 RepID=A0ACC3A0G5_9EURO|nr:negative cofactor 2 transcription regulator complex subunit ncb2 [Knufia sp. JES_112]